MNEVIFNSARRFSRTVDVVGGAVNAARTAQKAGDTELYALALRLAEEAIRAADTRRRELNVICQEAGFAV